MNKKFAAVGVSIVLLSLALTNCTGDKAVAAQLNIEPSTVIEKTDTTLKSMLTKSIKVQKVIVNTEKMTEVVNKLKKRVNKTWYVFGGETTRGWDCSGLVIWAYKHFEINLYHKASSQKYAAKPHRYVASKVKPGDIIACYGSEGLHVGIASDKPGYMIHAPRRGVTTKEDKVLKLFSSCTYTRLVQTN
jgi:cell wall-associated NlpC family hydrolase